MEHPFFPTTNRAEALRWLSIAVKLLSSRDLASSKSFATRARDSDPTLSLADQIIAVIDTLLAGDRRIGNNQPDWYGILRLSPPQGHDSELISTQYRNLVLLLNPQSNKYPFADQAFRLISEAYAVLSNPTRKAMYDKELAFYLQQQRQLDPFNFTLPTMQQNFLFFGGAAAASSVAQPQVHVGGSSSTMPNRFSELQQVNAGPPLVEPVGSGLTRQPQNFMTFTSGTNFVFGSDSGPNVSQTPMNNPVQSFPSFTGGNSAPAVGQNQDRLNNDIQKQPHEHYSNASERKGNDVNVSENAGDLREDEVNVDGVDVQEEEEDEERVDEPPDDPVSDGDELTFWTACPYCYCMYEYPSMYIDCCMRCQYCKSVFEAVTIKSPPPIVDGQESYFCCWGFLPLGVSMENWKKSNSASSAWTPFSPLFTSPPMGRVNTKAGGWVYIDDDEALMESSDSEEFDDVDWNKDIKKKKRKNLKANRATRTPNKIAKKVQVDKGKCVNVQDKMRNNITSEPSKKGTITSARKQPGRAAKNFGKLDLNVEFSNEAEEPPPKVNADHGPASGEEDNVEGNGFFEGLDEYLNSLPILNGANGDEKVVKVA